VAVRKLSISLDAELAERAARMAADEGTTLSRLIGLSLEDRLILADGRAAMREYEADEGAFTADERAEAAAFNDRLYGASDR